MNNLDVKYAQPRKKYMCMCVIVHRLQKNSTGFIKELYRFHTNLNKFHTTLNEMIGV